MKVKTLSVALALAGAVALGGAAGCSSEERDPVVPGVEALVFVKRAFQTEGGLGEDNVAGGAGQVFDYGRYHPGPDSGLYLLSPPTPEGRLTNLTAEFRDVDINGIDLSFDAKQVVMSMRHGGDDRYHLYLVNLDGSGIRQLTFEPWDDITPIFVPGGRVAFVTNQAYTEMGTRADEYNHGRGVAQIATIALATGDADRRLCSQNLSHTANPFLMSDGSVGYSRWEHLGPINDVKLFRMNPDCTQMVAVAGQHGKPFNSLVQATEIRPGVFIGIGTSRSRTIQAGALVQVDARARGGSGSIALDEQAATFDILTPAVPRTAADPPSGVGRFRSPRALPSTDKILVSWSDGEVNDRSELAGTAPQFGIYLWDPATRQRTLVYDDPNYWDLYATPVIARPVPEVRTGVTPGTYEPTSPAVIGSIDVTATSLDESVGGYGDAALRGMPLGAALSQAVRMRIIEGFSSEIGPVGQFGLTMHEGGAVLGEVPVHADGSWAARVPAYLPYHLQPIDEFGLAIRNQMLWIQAMPGEDRRCGGCHEGRTETILPRSGPVTIAQQVGPTNVVLPIAERREFPWAGSTVAGENVQDLLNAKCASCHSGGAGDPFAGQFYEMSVTPMGATEPLVFRIPVLDLSDRPIQTYYEREVVTYPASYVSLLMASAMMGRTEITGGNAEPIEWVEPGHARGSRFIAKVNAVSERDPSRTAWPTALHPENVGGPALTREERLMLIQSIDLGAQYWSRRNVEGAEAWRSMTTYYP
jgi:hypothetical protein